MSIESVVPSNYLTLCHPLLLLPSILPSIRVFSKESVLHIRWPKYWTFSFSISPSNEYSGLISFRMDWFDLPEVQGTLKSLLQHHKMWSTGEGNGKPLQYSCLKNPVKSMKRQKDKTLKDELPSSVGARYATGEEWRNNSRKNEETEPKQKQWPVVDQLSTLYIISVVYICQFQSPNSPHSPFLPWCSYNCFLCLCFISISVLQIGSSLPVS